MTSSYISYLRVSGGPGQVADGLGIEAQRQAIARFIEGAGSLLLAEHVEVQSGAENDRPVLAAALRQCRRTGSTLLVYRLDRLSRDAYLLLGIERSGVKVIATDNPHAHRLTSRLQAVLAEEERDRIKARTKAALEAAKNRGVALGGWRGGPAVDPTLGRAERTQRANAYARDIGPLAAEMRAAGMSLRRIAARLRTDGIRTPRGGAWSADAVRDLLQRHEKLTAAH